MEELTVTPDAPLRVTDSASPDVPMSICSMPLMEADRGPKSTFWLHSWIESKPSSPWASSQLSFEV